MEKTKTPLYILYYIDVPGRRLVKDSTIYDNEIISCQDLVSAAGNSITLTVPKYRTAQSGESFQVESRWVDIMNNQMSGGKLYFIVSSSSLNSNDYLADPIYTNTLRPEEYDPRIIQDDPIAYLPLFSGYLNSATANRDADTISFTFGGFDWVYNNKFQDVHGKGPNEGGEYEYAHFNWKYDPTGTIKLGSQESPTRLPLFTTEVLQGDDHRNSNIIARKDTTTAYLKREGQHKIIVNLNTQHTESYSSSVTITAYRTPCMTDSDEAKEAGKVVIGSASGTIEGGGPQITVTLDLTNTEETNMYDVPPTYQRYLYSESQGKGGDFVYEFWVEAYSSAGTDKNVTYSYCSCWISTSCYSSDHDQVYEDRSQTTHQASLAEVYAKFIRNRIEAIMDGSSIKNDPAAVEPGFDDLIYFDDYIQTRNYGWMYYNYGGAPDYNYNKFDTSIGLAVNELVKSYVLAVNPDGSQETLLPVWMTYLRSDGKICPDPVTGYSYDHAVYTDWLNTDVTYNIKDNYYNHFYTRFSSNDHKVESQYHTVSRTLDDYRPLNATIFKDPVQKNISVPYQGDPQEEGITDEEMWNRMGSELTKKAYEYRQNKFKYIYYPGGDVMIPGVRVGDWFVSTPESPLQYRRRITGIARVCEGGIIKWIYKMEGDE